MGTCLPRRSHVFGHFLQRLPISSTGFPSFSRRAYGHSTHQPQP